MLRYLLATVLALMPASAALANKVFVSNEKGNTVTVIDSENWEVLAEFPAGNRPRGITISPDGSELYVCASDDDLVRVFDPETYEEIHTLPSGPDPELVLKAAGASTGTRALQLAATRTSPRRSSRRSGGVVLGRVAACPVSEHRLTEVSSPHDIVRGAC